MRRKLVFFLMSIAILISFSVPVFAKTKSDSKFEYSTEIENTLGYIDTKTENNTYKNKGKVIIIDISRTSLENFNNIKFMREKLKSSGYLALMNIRGDKGYDDRRNFATMGATSRANIANELDLDFSESNVEDRDIYKYSTGLEPGKINLNNINNVDLLNQTMGEYKAKIGFLGETLKSNGKIVSVIGNNDYYKNGEIVKNRDFCLTFMDSKGRIDSGEIENLNIKNIKYPFGISTDYNKLKTLSTEYYNKSDLLYVNLGDTYRLDMYKPNLNKATYKKMKFSIYNDISSYLDYVFKMVGKNDTVYVMSSYPSSLDYSNWKRLTPVFRFDQSEDGIGTMITTTTRRNGVASNLDFGVEILDRFGIKNNEMLGKKLTSVVNPNRDSYIQKEYAKIVSISNIRMTIINIYVTLVSLFTIVAVIAFWQRNKISANYRNKTLKFLKETCKLGLIMPLAFLSAPILQPSTEVGISLSIVGFSVLYYLIARILFKKDDIKQIGLYAILIITLIIVDSLLHTPLMESNVMSYDPMVAARYYGIGNEYEGVAIGSAILGMAVILEYKKVSKILVSILFMAILFISAFPSMGANVGGAISGTIAYLVFVLKVWDIKIDIKKIMIIIGATVLLVAAFAAADIALNLGSHLGNFVKQVIINGPMEVINVFVRKIDMNIMLAQTTIWVNLLLVAILLLSINVFRPSKGYSGIKERHPYIYKAFTAIIIGCVITLLVNDSGIISAATNSLYLIIPSVIIMINSSSEEGAKKC